MAPPPAGGLKKLSGLCLDESQITDAGCAALAAALDSGALPALERLGLYDIPASAAAKEAVHEARANLSDGSSHGSSVSSGESVSETEEDEEQEESAPEEVW